MIGVRLGWSLAVRTLLGRSTFVLLAIMVGWVVMAGAVEHRASANNAADGVLLGAIFGLAVPVACWLLLSQIAGRLSLAEVLDGWAAYGANRRHAWLGTWLGLVVTASIFATLSCVAGLGVAHGGLGAAFVRDAATSSWIAVLGVAAYGSFLMLCAGLRYGMTIGAAALVGDWFLGSTHGAVALPFPRAHLANLLGGAAPMGMTQGHSSLVLAAISVSCVAISLWRLDP